MYKWMQENSKKILVIFAVGLMIVFILPSTAMQMFGPDEPIAGYVNNEPVRAREYGQAQAEWEWLHMCAQRLMELEEQLRFPIAPGPFRTLIASGAIQNFERNHELYYLLVREANQMGVQVNQDSIDALSELLSQYRIVEPPSNSSELQGRRRALANLLRISAALDRITASVKVSQPRMQQELADHFQQIHLKAVEFDASEFAKDVEEPSQEQIDRQIDQFGNVDPDAIDLETNPHAFSYRLPNRVKLQYVEIPIQQIRQAVESSEDEFDWKRRAFRIYNRNPERFPSTQPADELDPMLGGAGLTLGNGAPSTQPAARPTTRPFDEVYPEIKRELIEPLVQEKAAKIQERVRTLLQRGFERYQAEKAEKPWDGRLPIDVAYDSYEYLQAVAAIVQQEHGVSLNITSLESRWLEQADLEKLAGLDSAWYIAGPRFLVDWHPFAQFLMTQLEVFQTADSKEQADAANRLALYQPTPPFQNTAGDIYIARVIDAQPAHAPTTPEERQQVAQKAAADLKKAAAYEKALAAAKALQQKAEEDRLLQSAANQANRAIIEIGPVAHVFTDRGWLEQIGGYDLDESQRHEFLEQAFKLLRQVNPERQHPTRIIELPQAGKVLVAELDEVAPTPLPAALANFDAQAWAYQMAHSQDVIPIRQAWFDPENIRTRMGWKASE